MKVTFIKPHLQWNPGDEADIEQGVADYLLHMGMVTMEKADNETIDKVLTEKLKAVKSEKAEVKPVKKAKKKAAKKAIKKTAKK